MPTSTAVREPLAQQPHLRVVGRDDHDVLVARAAARRPPSVNVWPSSRSISAAIASASSSESTRFPSCSTASQRTPTPSEVVRSRALRDRAEPTLVERLRDEAADLRVHPPRLLEEEAELGRDRLVLAEQVLEHARAGAVGMDALRHLRELERVAEQDERRGRGAAGERVGEAVLAGLVDDERVELAVELLAREEPRRAGDELDLVDRARRRACPASRARSRRVVAVLDAAKVEPLLGRRRARPRRAGCGSPCGSAR